MTTSQIAALDTMRGATWRAQGAPPVEVTLLRRASALDMSSHTLAVYLGVEGAAWTPGRTGRLVITSGAAPLALSEVNHIQSSSEKM